MTGDGYIGDGGVVASVHEDAAAYAALGDAAAKEKIAGVIDGEAFVQAINHPSAADLSSGFPVGVLPKKYGGGILIMQPAMVHKQRGSRAPEMSKNKFTAVDYHAVQTLLDSGEALWEDDDRVTMGGRHAGRWYVLAFGRNKNLITLYSIGSNAKRYAREKARLLKK